MPKKSKGLALVPPASRPPAPSQVRVTHDVPTALRDSIRAFEHAVGGRAALIEFLSSADSDEQVYEVVKLLGDPANDERSLVLLCGQAGISPGQLFGAFDKATIVRAQILGRLEAAKQVPAAAKEVGRTALPHEQPCTACNGVGSFEEADAKGQTSTRRCTGCNGKGHVLREGDPDQQKTLFELVGLLKTGGGVQVQQNVITPAGAVVGGSLEQLQQVVSELIYRKPTHVDAEVVSSPTQSDSSTDESV